MMRLRLIFLLLLTGSGLYSQNPDNKKQGKDVTPEALYAMQYRVDDQGYLSSPSEVVTLMEAAVKMAAAGKMDTLSLIRQHARCRELMYFALRQKKLQMDEVKNAFSRLDKVLDDFLGCDKQQAFYKDLFLKDSTSTATMKEVVDGLNRCHCEGVDLYMKVSKRYYDKDTTPENALLVARYFLKKDGYGFALPLLQKAAASADAKVSSEANLEIAAAYRFYNRLEEAVGYANKAIQKNPSNAMAYIIIGECYYLGAASCGKTDLEKTGALWAAYDKYLKASKMDPSLKTMARIRMEVLNHRLPDADQLKALKLTEGAPYKAGCWIKETTQVRARK